MAKTKATRKSKTGAPSVRRPPLAAFNQGEAVTIVAINQSTIPYEQWKAAKSFQDLITVLQKYAAVFAEYWHIPCTVVVGDRFQQGCWAMVFTDNADVAGALGYHDTTPDGYPLLHVFVQTSLTDGDVPSVTASHELAEALGDPCCNLTFEMPDGTTGAYETADAVERDSFLIDGIPVSNFVLPAWFEPFPRPRYDYLGRCRRPFQILPGGYLPVKQGGVWTQIFGSKKAAKRYNAAAHPRMRLRPLPIRDYRKSRPKRARPRTGQKIVAAG